MTEESKLDGILLESAKIIESEEIDPEIKLIDKVIQDYAPEIAYLYQIREDEAEEQQTKTGRLHENRILGIVLKNYLDGKERITTGEVEQEYKKYFKEIARSTTSTYLNMLKKEATLYTERDGRVAYYVFREKPPISIKPFWFTRIFCIVPAYFHRSFHFSNLYINAEKHIQQYINENGSEQKDILLRNFKFITGLIIINILKNRSSKCIDCQFSKREIYKKLDEKINLAFKDRSDVLPNEITIDLIEKYSEIPMFDGIYIKDNFTMENVAKEISKCANIFKKDLDFQIMVSSRRETSRLNQRKLQDSTEEVESI
ncbi:MAG: hypothetical protein ACFE9Q_00220 [Candidatus Hodarchaeota archaeon]